MSVVLDRPTQNGTVTRHRRSGFQPRSVIDLVAMSPIAAGSRSYEGVRSSSASNLNWTMALVGARLAGDRSDSLVIVHFGHSSQ